MTDIIKSTHHNGMRFRIRTRKSRYYRALSVMCLAWIIDDLATMFGFAEHSWRTIALNIVFIGITHLLALTEEDNACRVYTPS
jgi:hypothetical protein